MISIYSKERDLHLLSFARQILIIMVHEVDAVYYVHRRIPIQSGGCLFVMPRGERLFLMIHKADACSICPSKQTFVYSVKQIIIYHVPTMHTPTSYFYEMDPYFHTP